MRVERVAPSRDIFKKLEKKSNNQILPYNNSNLYNYNITSMHSIIHFDMITSAYLFSNSIIVSGILICFSHERP